MAEDIGVVITGDRKVAIEFEQFPQNLHRRLRDRIGSLTAELEDRVLFFVPRGKGETGRHLASLIKKQIFDEPEKITGRVTVGGDFEKAGAVEYGTHSTFTVKGHDARLDHVFAKKLNATTDVFVQAHTRTVNIEGARFLRRAEQSMIGPATEGLREATEQAAAEANE